MITKAYCHETFEKALPYVFKSRIERGGGGGGGWGKSLAFGRRGEGGGGEVE